MGIFWLFYPPKTFKEDILRWLCCGYSAGIIIIEKGDSQATAGLQRAKIRKKVQGKRRSPQRLKSTSFEIFSNGMGGLRGEEKISRIIDFTL